MSATGNPVSLEAVVPEYRAALRELDESQRPRTLGDRERDVGVADIERDRAPGRDGKLASDHRLDDALPSAAAARAAKRYRPGGVPSIRENAREKANSDA